MNALEVILMCVASLVAATSVLVLSYVLAELRLFHRDLKSTFLSVFRKEQENTRPGRVIHPEDMAGREEEEEPFPGVFPHPFRRER